MDADRAHGRWVVRTADRSVMLCKGWGSWNEAAARGFAAEVHAAMHRLDRPWAVIVDFRDWDAGVLDAEPILRRVNEAGVRNGCICRAEVRGAQVLAEMQRLQLHVSVPDGFHFGAFGTLSEAARWLTQRGYPLAPERARKLVSDAVSGEA